MTRARAARSRPAVRRRPRASSLNRPSLQERILAHPFFRGMDRRFVNSVSRTATERTYEAGRCLIREGDPANAFYLIFAGSVGIEISATGWPYPREPVQTIGPGEVLGWSWILPPYLWRFDGRAITDTRAAVLDAVELRAALKSRPGAGYELMLRLLPVVGQRLESTRVQVNLCYSTHGNRSVAR